MFLDSWDGEKWVIRMDGLDVISGNGGCGYFPVQYNCGGSWVCESMRSFSFIKKHSASSITF